MNVAVKGYERLAVDYLALPEATAEFQLEPSFLKL